MTTTIIWILTNPLTPRFRFSHRSALLSESTSLHRHNRNGDLLEEYFPAQRTPNIDINPDQIRFDTKASSLAPNVRKCEETLASKKQK